MKRNFGLFFTLALIASMLLGGVASANYFDKTTSYGQMRIYYKSTPPAVCDAFIIGVGTAMSRDSYDNLAAAISNYGYVVVIMDHAPGNMVKSDATAYRNCALDIQNNILGWLSGTGIAGINHWILGGHSAGGQAAQTAVANDSSLADAVFSIDPYNCSNAGTVSVPAMYWGFDVTTCFVTKDDAAKAAYYHSAAHRAFYRVNKVYSWGPCGYSPKYYHCSFADGSCPACTNCMYPPSYFFTDIANSVNKFVNASFYGTWSKANLAISSTTPLVLFVDSDAP